MIDTPSPITAIKAFLLADTSVSDECGDRVFGVEIPDDRTDSMPEPTIVVKYAGDPGAIGGGYQEFGDIRVDIICYATTPFGAEQVRLAVQRAMKHMRRGTWEGCVLHWAKRSGGIPPGRDPDTDWPLAVTTWQVLVGETKVL